MKKRIGNDITFTWHIYRKSGDTQTPESFDGKDVEVKLISPLQRPVTIEDVTIATGVVTFTFRGKHQVTLGNYVAVLLENKGENGMVTLDVVNAVTLVPHSYMEEDGDEGDVIEAEAVELTSTISAGSGGGIEQQQADWAQTDDTAVDYIKNKPNPDLFAKLDVSNEHEQNTFDTYKQLYGGEQKLRRTSIGGGGLLLRVGRLQPVWFEYEDAKKLNDLPTATELAQELGGKANSADLAEVATSGSYNDLSDKPDLSGFITKSVDNLVNYYLKSETYTKTEVQQLIGAIQQFHYEVYPTLPQTGASNVLYLIGPTGTGADKYEEYVYANNDFTKIGDTSIDLSGYVTTQALNTALADYVTSSALSTTLLPIYNRLEDVEEALTETLPVESFIMDDYSIGSETITGTNISSNGTVPIKECRVPYVSEPTITIDGVTYSKAIRKDFTMPYTDGVLAKFDLEEKGNLMVYYGFGGGGSYGTYYLQFYFTSDDGTITDELLASRDVFDTAREIDKLSITIPKKGTLTIRAWDNVEGRLEDNGFSTNIVRMDFTATPLINVSALKTTKADKSEMSVVPGTGADADKTTITLKQDTSATVLTAHQDVSGKEDVTNIVTPVNATDATLPITTLTCEVGKYYRIDVAVDTLAITLPTMTDLTTVRTVVICLTADTNPAVTISAADNKDVYYQDGFEIEAGNTYEINALFNGAAWIVASVKINVE